MLEKFVYDLGVFLFRPTRLGKSESFGSGTSDDKVNKERDKAKH